MNIFSLKEHPHHEPINSQGDILTQEWFGFNHDTPVVWVKYEVRQDGTVWLHSIETREEYRNQGYAVQALEIIKDRHHAETIYHEGGYTPEGLDFISPHCEWVGYKWIPKKDGEKPTANFRSMNFVKSWDVEQQF